MSASVTSKSSSPYSEKSYLFTFAASAVVAFSFSLSLLYSAPRLSVLLSKKYVPLVFSVVVFSARSCWPLSFILSCIKKLSSSSLSYLPVCESEAVYPLIFSKATLVLSLAVRFSVLPSVRSYLFTTRRRSSAISSFSVALYIIFAPKFASSFLRLVNARSSSNL